MLCLDPNSEASLPPAQNFSTDQRQLSPNLYLMGKYEDLVESESGVETMQCNTLHTHWLSGHSNTTNVRDKYSWQWPELLIIYIMYF